VELLRTFGLLMADSREHVHTPFTYLKSCPIGFDDGLRIKTDDVRKVGGTSSPAASPHTDM